MSGHLHVVLCTVAPLLAGQHPRSWCWNEVIVLKENKGEVTIQGRKIVNFETYPFALEVNIKQHSWSVCSFVHDKICQLYDCEVKLKFPSMLHDVTWCSTLYFQLYDICCIMNLWNDDSWIVFVNHSKIDSEFWYKVPFWSFATFGHVAIGMHLKIIRRPTEYWVKFMAAKNSRLIQALGHLESMEVKWWKYIWFCSTSC